MDLMNLVATLVLDSSAYMRGVEEAVAASVQLGDTVAAAHARMTALAGEVQGVFRGLAGASGVWGRDMIGGFIDGIASMWGSLTRTVSGVAETVRRYLHFSEPDVGPLSDFHTYAPDMMALFAKGIEDNEGLIADAVGGAFDLGPKIRRSQTPAGGGEVVVPRGGGGTTIEFWFDGVRRWVYNATEAERQRVGVKLADA